MNRRRTELNVGAVSFVPVRKKTENPPKSCDLQRVSQTTAVVEFCGARERTRTFTAVKPPAPEAGASTNFATRALRKEIMK